MSYIPDSSLLGGMMVEDARCMGMPHIGARYTSPTQDRYELLPEALCAYCGRPATCVHHQPHKGMGGKRVLTLHGKVLRPALIALCGFGNESGCHGLHHQGGLPIRWVWNDPEAERKWWEGEFTLLESNDFCLNALGRWEIG